MREVDDGGGYVELTLGEESDITGVVLAFRKDGQLHELTEFEPPLVAKFEQL